MTQTLTPLTFEYVLLGFLCQGPVHVYDLHKQICSLEGISLVWHIQQSHLFRLNPA
jgi:hypothetical protein